MTTWRHAVVDDGFCGVCIYDGDSPVCADPTPDPASPCGATIDVWGDACLSPESSMEHVTGHEYRPSGCLSCGHPIEEATR